MQIERLDVTVVVPVTRIAATNRLLRSLACSIRHCQFCPTSLILVCSATVASQLNFVSCIPIYVVHVQSQNVSYRRNIGSRYADTEWILYLDDDIVVPKQYFTQLRKQINRNGTDIIQGIAWRPVHRNALIAKLEAIHYLRTIRRDWSTRLLGQLDPRNLLIKRTVAWEFPFNERLPYGGEGHELMNRLEKAGISTCLCPVLEVYHDHRTTLWSTACQKYRYGRGRAQLYYYRSLPKSSIITFLKRHFGWSIKTLIQGQMSVAEWVYSIFIYISFWLGFLAETISTKLGGLPIRNFARTRKSSPQPGAQLPSRLEAPRVPEKTARGKVCRNLWLRINKHHSTISYTKKLQDIRITANSLIWGDVYFVLQKIIHDFGHHSIPCIYFDPPFRAKDCESWQVSPSSKYLSYETWLRTRLMLCAELLSYDGSIWIQTSPLTAPLVRRLASQLFPDKYYVAEYRWYCNRLNARNPKTFDYNILLYYGSPRVRAKPELKRIRFPESCVRKTLNTNLHCLSTTWDDIYVSFPNDPKRTYWIAPVKPRKLVHRIISLGSQEGDIVLDCFTGTGIVIELAQSMGRNWISCDARFRCVEAAAKRLTRFMRNRRRTSQQEPIRVITFE